MSSSEFHHYTRDEFLAEFYPDPAGKAAIAAGMKQLRAEQRAFRARRDAPPPRHQPSPSSNPAPKQPDQSASVACQELRGQG